MSNKIKEVLQIGSRLTSSFNDAVNQNGSSSLPRKTVYSQYKVQYDPSGFQSWLDLQDGTVD